MFFCNSNLWLRFMIYSPIFHQGAMTVPQYRLIFLLTHKEVGSGRRQSKLLFHVLGRVGDLANDGVKPQNARTKKQAED